MAEGEMCEVCGMPKAEGDHTHGGDSAGGAAAPGGAAPMPAEKKPWWKFW